MKLITFILIIAILLGLNSCYMGEPSYEVFEKRMNANAHYIFNPNINKEYREIYSEDKYIYKMEGPKGCYYGFLTNRDDKPERVIGWVIISGKEFCKEQQDYAF